MAGDGCVAKTQQWHSDVAHYSRKAEFQYLPVDVVSEMWLHLLAFSGFCDSGSLFFDLPLM